MSDCLGRAARPCDDDCPTRLSSAVYAALNLLDNVFRAHVYLFTSITRRYSMYRGRPFGPRSVSGHVASENFLHSWNGTSHIRSGQYTATGCMSRLDYCDLRMEVWNFCAQFALPFWDQYGRRMRKMITIDTIRSTCWSTDGRDLQSQTLLILCEFVVDFLYNKLYTKPSKCTRLS